MWVFVFDLNMDVWKGFLGHFEYVLMRTKKIEMKINWTEMQVDMLGGLVERTG